HLPLRDLSEDPGGGRAGGPDDEEGVMDPRETDPAADLERLEHEIRGKLHWFEADRRHFLNLLGGGLLICLRAPRAQAQESGRAQAGREAPRDISAWLHIGQNGKIQVYTGKVEMGQNIRTSLAQQVAEELRVPVGAIEMVMGDTIRTPWDAGTF